MLQLCLCFLFCRQKTWAWAWLNVTLFCSILFRCSDEYGLFKFPNDSIFFIVYNFCHISFHSIVLIPRAFCCFRLGYFSIFVFRLCLIILALCGPLSLLHISSRSCTECCQGSCFLYLVLWLQSSWECSAAYIVIWILLVFRIFYRLYYFFRYPPMLSRITRVLSHFLDRRWRKQ